MKGKNLIREALFAIADQLSEHEIKLTDYLRLLELRNETGERTLSPIRAGWFKECQSESRETDG
jgi:hypothetical protein